MQEGSGISILQRSLEHCIPLKCEAGDRSWAENALFVSYTNLADLDEALQRVAICIRSARRGGGSAGGWSIGALPLVAKQEAEALLAPTQPTDEDRHLAVQRHIQRRCDGK